MNYLQAPWEVESVELPPNWPQEGRIVYENYDTRYREGLDLVLSSLNLETLPGEKVGICGRTGSLNSINFILSNLQLYTIANGYTLPFMKV